MQQKAKWMQQFKRPIVMTILRRDLEKEEEDTIIDNNDVENLQRI